MWATEKEKKIIKIIFEKYYFKFRELIKNVCLEYDSHNIDVYQALFGNFLNNCLGNLIIDASNADIEGIKHNEKMFISELRNFFTQAIENIKQKNEGKNDE